MHPALTRLSSLTVFAASLVALSGCGAAVQKNDALSARKQVEDPKMLAEHGRAYADLGDDTRAEQYLSAALASGADPKTIMPLLLKSCVRAGHLRLAVEYAESQLARDPEDAHLRFLAGALEASIGNRVEARTNLERAAADLPNDSKVQFHVAAFFRDDAADKIAADPYFREYLRLEPKGEHAAEARASIMERVQ